jgi:hypothetical protein
MDHVIVKFRFENRLHSLIQEAFADGLCAGIIVQTASEELADFAHKSNDPEAMDAAVSTF